MNKDIEWTHITEDGEKARVVGQDNSGMSIWIHIDDFIDYDKPDYGYDYKYTLIPDWREEIKVGDLVSIDGASFHRIEHLAQDGFKFKESGLIYKHTSIKAKAEVTHE